MMLSFLIDVAKAVARSKMRGGFLFLLWTFSSPAVAAETLIAFEPDFRLQTGQHGEARLAGIRPLACEGWEVIRQDWIGAPVRVMPVQPPVTDRYGRVFVKVSKPQGESLRATLLEEGCAMEYGVEKPSSEPSAHQIYPVEQAEKALHQWAVLEGIVHTVSDQRTGLYVQFGEDWRTDTTLYIPRHMLKNMDKQVLLRLAGETVQFRGWVHPYYGPRVTLHHANMLTIKEPIP